MKKRTLHRGVKWFLLLLQQINGAIAATVLIVLLSNFFVMDETDQYYDTYHFNIMETAETFEESGVFRDVLLSHVDQIVTNVVIGSQIGEDGNYDANFPVNISTYADRKSLELEMEEAVEYRLSDLLKWYRSGMAYEIIAEKDWPFTGDNSLYYNESGDLLREDFLPLDGVSLVERAESEAEYRRMVDDLERSVYDLGYNMEFMESRKDKFRAENSNLKYLFVIAGSDGKTRTFSNTDLEGTEAEAYFKSLGVYAIYDTDTLDFSTNMKGFSSVYLQNEFNSHSYVYQRGTLAYVGVDTDYKINDIYAKANTSYAIMQDSWYYMIAFGASMLVWFVILAYLSVMVGRKKDAEGKVIIESEWMDDIPTELHIIVYAGVFVLVTLLCVLVYGESKLLFFEPEGEMLRGGYILVCLFLSIWCCSFWYSMIRRFKLHIICKNSLCGMLIRALYRGIKGFGNCVKDWCLTCYDNAGTITRVVVPMLIVILGNFFGGFVSLYFIGVRGDNVSTLFGMVSALVVLVVDGIYAYCIAKSDLCRKTIINGIIRIREGEMDYQLDTAEMHGENLELGEAVNSIGNGIKKAVEASMKNERMKADLITNVSHDIKTPLTSIINYVDLLKREKIEDEPIRGYIEVLDAKSQRLKQLTDDLVEASKISSGNIVLNFENIKLKQLLMQSVGEFSEKFEQKNLTVVESYPEEEIYINADPARMWRVIENLFNNIFKYSLEGTRVYVELSKDRQKDQNSVQLSIKNISKNPLKVHPEELTERFIRGDESRTTEGSGLGLSIARNLMELQGGKLNIYLDGDLFKVILYFSEAFPALLKSAEKVSEEGTVNTEE